MTVPSANTWRKVPKFPLPSARQTATLVTIGSASVAGRVTRAVGAILGAGPAAVGGVVGPGVFG